METKDVKALKYVIKVSKKRYREVKNMVNKKMKFIKEVMDVTERDNVEEKGIVYWQNKYVELENIVLEYMKNGADDLKRSKTEEETELYKYIVEIAKNV